MNVLKNEVINDPLDRGYSNMSNQQVANSLNAVDREIDVPAPIRSVVTYLMLVQKWINIKDAANNIAHPARGLCISFLDVSNNVNFESLDFTDLQLVGMIDAMVAANVIDNSDKTNVLAMGKRRVSRAKEIGLNHHVKVGHIEGVRK